jgi:hypothetical protein
MFRILGEVGWLEFFKIHVAYLETQYLSPFPTVSREVFDVIGQDPSVYKSNQLHAWLHVDIFFLS